MADIVYPDFLPEPKRAGYGFTPTSPIRKDTMTNGRTRRQRISTKTPTSTALQWLMTDGQAALFEAWFSTALIDGVAWFQMPLRTPLGNLEQYRCRFEDIYDGPHLDEGSNLWIVTATLELEQRPLLPTELLAFPDMVLNAEILDRAANREWPKA